MEKLEKIFLAVQRGCQRKHISIYLNHGELHLSKLSSVIKESFNIAEEPIYLIPFDCQVGGEDVIDYVKQFVKCPCFVLNIKDADDINQSERCSISQEGYGISLSPPRRFESYPESENMIDNIFNNLETKEELVKFINTECKAVCQSFSNTKELADTDRLVISKCIIRQLLNINPNRMLQRFDFERLAHWICEIFTGEKSEIYYKKFTNGKIASGKLYDAYTNQRKKLAKSGIIRRRTRNCKNSIN